VKLEWHPLAEADRDTIFDYIEEDNPLAAIAVDERIAEQVAVLTRFPEGGRPGRVAGTRELVIKRTPTSRRTESGTTRFGSCACCTRRNSGQTIYQCDPANAIGYFN